MERTLSLLNPMERTLSLSMHLICTQLHRVMAQWGTCLLLSLVLLVPIISLCEPAEYFIRPTAFTTNTSCPDQPCLTLNQYMKSTGYYMQSNTVLTFLPGKHVLKGPLQIENVKNVTLKSSPDGSSMYSQLIVKFSSKNGSLNTQSSIKMINVTNVVIIDIRLEMWTPNVSGVIVEQSTLMYTCNLTFVMSKGIIHVP